MPISPSPEAFTVVAIGLLVGLIVFLILQIITNVQLHRLASPTLEHARAKSRVDADRILSEAREEAHRIVAEAHATAASLLEKQKSEIDARMALYQNALEALSQGAQRSITEGSEKARKIQSEVTQQFSGQVGTQSENIKNNLGRIEGSVDAFLKTTQTQIDAIHHAIEDAGRTAQEGFGRVSAEVAAEEKKRADERVALLLKEVDQEIEMYRTNRKRLVDEHIVDMIAETSRVVLRKALTQDDHTDLVEAALKEAHATGMI